MASIPTPGPRRWSPFGSLPELRRDPLGTLLDARSKYGNVVKFRAGIWFALLLAHPEDIQHVLQDNTDNYRKGFTFDYLKPILGLGLLTNEGEPWRRQRRLAQPAFHHQRLAELASTMTGAAERLVSRWRAEPAPGVVDVAAEMTGLTVEVVSQAILGVDFGANSGEVRNAVRVAQEHVNSQITHLFSVPDRFPTPGNLDFKRALKLLDAAVYSIIELRRAESSPEGSANDLVSLLLEARDEESGEGMTDLELRDEVMTIFLAGHETTANALAWTWHLLSVNPEAEERLLAEIDHVLGGRPACFGDLPRLQYTRMVFDEALRLGPPVWAVCRFPLADDEAGGHRIPAHASVILSPYVTHRHPEFWEDPERFDPERFQPKRAAERPRYAYFPFGGGPRVCIGSEFALMEGVLTLATIAPEFRLRPAPGHQVQPEPLITLRPSGGLPMLLERRKALG